MRGTAHSLVGLLFVGAAVLATSEARAASCSGVELRVNNRTAELATNVTAEITRVQGELIAESIRQTQQIVSAMRVLNSQENLSSQNTSTATQKAIEASSAAYGAHRQRMAQLEATQKYRSLGYNACGALRTGMRLPTAMTTAEQARATMVASIGNLPGVEHTTEDTQAWLARARDGGEYGAEALFSGDPERAKRFIDFVLGPPEAARPGIKDNAEGASDRVSNFRKDALRSVSIYTLSSVASDAVTGGPDETLKTIASQWDGDDGGRRWAAAMSASHERGVMLDLVRIEAANVAAQAIELKKLARQELTLSSYALARLDSIIGRMTGTQRQRGPGIQAAR